MSDGTYYGYTGSLAKRLKELGLSPGDRIRVETGGATFEGVLMPRYAIAKVPDIIVIKLDNGYNVGLRAGDEAKIIKVAQKREGSGARAEAQKAGRNKEVVILSTGGTIASRVDYETGAVIPALSTEEIIEWAPDLAEIASFEAKEIMRVFSEDITPSDWEKLASEIYKAMVEGVRGVVVAHGTDMMAYSAAAMAFAIRDMPVPVVFVGAQRSSDRPSSDSIMNLRAALIVASRSPFAESVIAMHATSSDELVAVHRGVKARKMHTSRRDAFQSVNDKPLALVNTFSGEIRVVGKIIRKRDEKREPRLENKFDERVAIVKAYPGVQPDVIDYLVDRGYHGIVIEGSGLGHISNRLVDSIRRAVESGIPVVMTSQCLFGRVNLNVYATGRRLLEAGVIPGEDMLPETAFVKLSWILGSKTRDLKEVRKLMLTNFEGEINPRHTIDLFPRWPHE